MTSRGQLVVRYIGDTRDLKKSSDRAGKILGGVAKVGKGLAIGVGAVAVGVGVLAVKTTKDLARVERLGKQTQAVIKATGGAAGRSVKQVDALATKLEKMTGVEAESVTEGQNMLLTFKNIKGKTFDEATKSMLDMGVAMNKGSLKGLDLSKTSIQMGKALNNPIKGISALSKVGVSFSDQQKKQIETMQKAGDMAGAQGVILKELKGEFGGAAAAAGKTTEGMAAKIENTFGNIAEKAMSFVLPMLMTLMEWVNAKVMPALSAFGDWLTGPGAEGLQRFGGFLKDRVLPPLQAFGGFIVGMVSWMSKNRDLMGALAVGIGAVVGVMVVWAAVTKAVAAVQLVLNAVMAANPIGIVLLAIVGLVAGLVWFFTKTKTGQKIVKAVWGGIKSAIKGVADWWTNTAWPAIRGALSAMGDWFRMVGRVARRIWNGIRDAMGSAWRWIKKNVIDAFVFGLRVWAEIFRQVGRRVRGVWDGVRDALGRGWRWIRENVIDRFRRGISNLADSVRSGARRIGRWFSGIWDTTRRVWGYIRARVFDKMRSVLGSLVRGFKSARDRIADVWNGLKRTAAKPVNFLIKWVWNRGLRKVLNAIPGVDLPEVKPIKFARGGPVRGGVPGKDSVRAWLMPGEEVWTTKEVRAAGGHGVMKQMRQAVLKGNLNGDPKFGNGGSLTSEQIARGQAYAKQQNGKPYIWGSTGPSGFDCSGLISAITQVIRGGNPGSRLGATSSFPWSGFKRGPGQFTVGSTPNYGGSGVGHMVGNLAGLGVESRGGTGVILGPGAMSTGNSAFTQYHLGAGGKAGSDGGWLDTISSVLGRLKKLPGQIQEMLSGGSWIGGFLKKLTTGLWSSMATFVNKKIPDIGSYKTNPIPTKFANGGYVKRRPGGVNAIIGEGKYDEIVAQIRPGGPRASGGGDLTINLEVGGKQFGTVVVDTVRRAVKSSGGSVQATLGRR